MSFLDQIKDFSAKDLKPTAVKITTTSGQQFVEVKDRYGRYKKTAVADGARISLGFIGDVKPDLQVGEVLPGLVMGSQDVAADQMLLTKHQVTHILNLASMVENIFPDEYTYLKLEVLDTPETNIVQYFDQSFQFISDGRKQGCVLVHCNAGVSRSASVVIGYLMKYENMDFNQAFDHLKTARPSIRPNDGFLKQLKEYKT